MTRPIIPGFYPDPTVCRVNDDYYLATSSFEYLPGAPIFHSTDLLNWTQVGHAFDRPGQLALDGTSSGGVFAPTIRHHAGRFWLVTTNVSGAEAGHMIINAPSASGPWSDPVFTDEFVGIDPDLTWDDNGHSYLTWSSYRPGLEGIAQVEIDPFTGQSLGEPRLLWTGSGLAWPESPHLYRVGDWWILLIAEGGTERGHVITVARSRAITGPFEGAPQNPIFSHRSTSSPVQNTGHGDLVQNADGSWAMVYLAARPRGITPGFHVNGRETFLAGVDWVDGWPVVLEDRFDVEAGDTSFVDHFEGTLSPRWVSPGILPTAWVRGSDEPGLELEGAVDGSLRLLATRPQDEEWEAEAIVAVDGVGRMVLRLDDDHWAAIEVNETSVVGLLNIVAGQLQLGRIERPSAPELTLRISATTTERSHNAPGGPDVIELSVVADGGPEELGAFDGRYLSTEVAGGFTGRVVGIAPVEGRLRLRAFSYRAGR